MRLPCNDTIKNCLVSYLAAKNNGDVPIVMKKFLKHTLKFRTLDNIDKTLLPGVTLDVNIDGKPVTNFYNANNGEFLISAYEYSKISILASKSGYITNNNITNASVSKLASSPQSDRDILMKLPPCSKSGDDSVASENGSVKEYDLQQSRGVFRFDYYTDSAKDRIIIYNCRAKDKKSSNIIFDKNIATYQSTLYENVVFTSRVITVEVIGNTRWNYTVNCP